MPVVLSVVSGLIVTAALVSVGFDLARWEAQEQIWRAAPPSPERPAGRPPFPGRWRLPGLRADRATAALATAGTAGRSDVAVRYRCAVRTNFFMLQPVWCSIQW